MKEWNREYTSLFFTDDVHLMNSSKVSSSFSLLLFHVNLEYSASAVLDNDKKLKYARHNDDVENSRQHSNSYKQCLFHQTSWFKLKCVLSTKNCWEIPFRKLYLLVTPIVSVKNITDFEVKHFHNLHVCAGQAEEVALPDVGVCRCPKYKIHFFNTIRIYC